jgi:hypothetical protein
MTSALSAGLAAVRRLVERVVFGPLPGDPNCPDCHGRGAYAFDAGHGDVMDVRPCDCIRTRR